MPERIDPSLGLCTAETWFEPGNNVEPETAAVLKIIRTRDKFSLHHHGREDVWFVAHHGAVKSRLGYSNDSERVTIYLNGLINNLWIGAETTLPIIKTQHHYRICVGNNVICSDKQAA